MLKQSALTAALLAATTGLAHAHPGHADQSIHLVEWLMGAALLAGSIVVLRIMRRKLRRSR